METPPVGAFLWIPILLISIYSGIRAFRISHLIFIDSKSRFKKNILGQIPFSQLSVAQSLPPDNRSNSKLIKKLIFTKKVFYWCLVISAGLFILPYLLSYLLLD
ncbi:MAG TPA: hypothetical protein VKT28_12305 [Puia sp.]|nr:hypothetical protein [Puia sp.]